MKTCFFIGHRETSVEILPALLAEVERHIAEYGVTAFVVGNYGGFDLMAAKAVITAKKQHEGIELYLLLPYHPAERSATLPHGFDGTWYPPDMENVPRRLAIVRANCYAVDYANYLIACVWHPASNAQGILEYAQKRERKGKITVTNLINGM